MPVRKSVRRRRGATTVEYALLLAMAVTALTALAYTGYALSDVFSRADRDLAVGTGTLAGFDLAPGGWSGDDTVTLPLTVTLSRATADEGPAHVRLTTADGTAHAGTDYIALDLVLDFDGNAQQSRTVALTANRGSLYGAAGLTLQVALSDPQNAVLAGSGTVTLTIPGRDAPPAVSFASGENIALTEGGDPVAATVILDRAAASTVTVPFTLEPGTADLLDVLTDPDNPGTLSFAPGSTSAELRLTAPHDGSREPEETAVLRLGTPEGGTAGATVQRTVRIADDGVPPVLTLNGAPDAPLQEGGASILLGLRLSGTSTDDASAVLRVLNADDSPSDDVTVILGGTTLAPGSRVTLPAGQTESDLTVSADSDGVFEGEETVRLQLSDPQGASLGSPAELPIRIADTENAPELGFDPAAIAVTEGEDAVLTVALSHPAAQAIAVPYTLAGSGATPADPASDMPGTAASGTLTIPAGAASAQLTLPTAADAVYEGDETLTVTLGAPSLGTLTGAGALITLHDSLDVPVLAFAADAATSLGEDAGQTAWAVRLDHASTATVTASWTLSAGSGGTGATVPGDIGPAGGTLTFAPGATEAGIALTPIADGISEGDETAVLALSAPQNASLGGSGSLTLTLVDADALPIAGFDTDTPSGSIDEAAGSIQFTVTLDRAASRDISVPYSLGGTAASGDYTAVPNGAVAIAAGSRAGTLTLTAVPNTVDAPDKTVVLTLGTPSGGLATRTSDTTAQSRTVTIRDDDVDAFDFADAPVGTYGASYTSNTITIAGSPSPVAVSADWASGSGTVMFRKNSDVPASDVSVKTGDTLAVVAPYPAAFSGSASLRVTVGGRTDSMALTTGPARSCLQHRQMAGQTSNGTYSIDPDGNGAIQVQCDMTTQGGGWTVFQSRSSGGTGFQVGWAAYKAGFGTPGSDHWLGNDTLARLTASGSWRLRVDLSYGGQTAYEEYPTFSIGNEAAGYALHLGSPAVGNAGDGFLSAGADGKGFVTLDRDNASACAANYRGGWWYNQCHWSNLNGEWGNETNYARGLSWRPWRGYYRSVASQMKIREASAGGSGAVTSANAPVIAAATLPDAIVGVPYTYQFSASDADGNGIYFSDDTFDLAGPIARVSSSGLLSFTPTTAFDNGSYTLIAADGTGQFATRSFAIRIHAARDCQDYYRANPALPSGTYSIDPNQNGTSFNAYCLMNFDNSGTGWTVIASSFANGPGDFTSKPFNVGWNTAVNSGVGSAGIGGNYFMAMKNYAAVASYSRPMQLRWYAQSGKPADPYQLTERYTGHYLDTTANYTWRGTQSYSLNGTLVYGGQPLTTTDADHDQAGNNCADSFGSFGWYTACHDAHFWSMTNEQYARGGTAVSNGYSNYGPDASGSYNTWYHLIILVAPI